MKFFFLSLIVLVLACEAETKTTQTSASLFVQVLGVAQDAGYPQIGCKKECCKLYHDGQKEAERVTCLGIIDRSAKKSWLVEATPDIVSQWQSLQEACPECEISGILLTHAHIGHYTGLVHLGREALGAKNFPVYAMPRMREFLENNGPWSQLVALKNIKLMPIKEDSVIQLSQNISVVPLLVPHRDEFSETVGYRVNGNSKHLVFIPDIDKWDKWATSILDVVRKNDYLLLDGTFFDNLELPGRDMNEIPHPFIAESTKLFSTLEDEERRKICFIHFNHSNPVLFNTSKKYTFVNETGFNIAEDGLILPL